MSKEVTVTFWNTMDNLFEVTSAHNFFMMKMLSFSFYIAERIFSPSSVTLYVLATYFIKSTLLAIS